MRLVSSLCFASFLGLAGCNGGDSPEVDPCAALVDQCLVNQQACVADSTGAHCAACAAGTYAASSGKCESIGTNPLAHDFADFTTKPGEEVLGLCQSWTLNNPDEIWVNAVSLVQDEASHHSNWTYVPDNQFTGPDGVWTCTDRKYSELTAALAGGVLYAQSTQATHEVQKFPNSGAVRIPPYSRIIGDVHLLNTTSAAVTGHVTLSLYPLPLADVKVKLTPFHLSYDGLNIPPHATSRFRGDCDIASTWPLATGTPFGMKVYYILPHTHKLATRFFVDVFGGPDNGKSLLSVEGFNSDPRGRSFDPPLDMKGAQGFSFGCEYQNPRSDAVKWGYGDQEMCELLGFAESRAGFESRVPDANADGTDGSVEVFTGTCSTDAFMWDFHKDGGPGPM